MIVVLNDIGNWIINKEEKWKKNLYSTGLLFDHQIYSKST